MSAPAQNLDQEIKQQNRIVAGWLLFCHERRQEYLNQRQAILHSSGPCLSDAMPGGKNITGDPTGRKGQKLADLEKARQWLKLVAEVERRLPEELQVFLKLRREYRYARGRTGWTAAVQWRFAQEMAAAGKDVWVENRKTFYDWWNKIVDYTARLAAKRNLL